jgi:hypothetical protein
VFSSSSIKIDPGKSIHQDELFRNSFTKSSAKIDQRNESTTVAHGALEIVENFKFLPLFTKSLILNQDIDGKDEINEVTSDLNPSFMCTSKSEIN